MAVRLNVIMVHPPASSTAAQRLSAGVVGELIGLSGIDLTLVEPLDQIDPASADYLTISSLAGDIALLAWCPVAESIQSLAALGFRGSRAAHTHDPDVVNSEPSRRIYGYDLRDFDAAEPLRDALQELLGSRQVRTYSLDIPIPGEPAVRGPAHARVEPSPTAKATESSTSQRIDDADQGGRPAKPPPDLDSLVDQLDGFDP